MTKLPQTFKGRADQKGFTFTEVNRLNNVAIYSKFQEATPSTPQSLTTYEVFVARVCPLTHFPDGTVTEEHETIPSASKWGTVAFTCTSLIRATSRFNLLLQNQRQK